jgi:glutamine synthetase
MTVVEYIWLGGNNEFRSKTRVLDNVNIAAISIKDIPDWNYDGSSTGQATGRESEVIIKPKTLFNNPFGQPYDYIVLCDTYLPDGSPLYNNTRIVADMIFNQKLDEEPWFGLEQEYFLIDPTTNKPLGFDETGKQGQYYCSVGCENAFGRKFIDEHFRMCLHAGVKIGGINAEVAPGQWEFQIGPCVGIDAGDHLWTARYILQRLGEIHNVKIDLSPKPLKGDWNGSGCHTNYSTKNMREGTDEKTGLNYIDEAIDKLSKNHQEHMKLYGSGNEERMTGKHETASYTVFTDGVANRGASVRRGNETIKNKKGYFEDRRPSANCDPYLVTSAIFKTTCLNA